MERKRREGNSAALTFLHGMSSHTLHVCFFRGSWKFRVCIKIISDKEDGQGESIKVAHLMANDGYDLLEATIISDLDIGNSNSLTVSCDCC